MEKTKEQKWTEYHCQEMVLILLILSTDLSTYTEDELMIFGEDIEGRVDTLFNTKWAVNLQYYVGTNVSVGAELTELGERVIKLYAPQWSNRLMQADPEVLAIRVMANELLYKLQIEYTEPNQYADNNLNIDW